MGVNSNYVVKIEVSSKFEGVMSYDKLEKTKKEVNSQQVTEIKII